MGLLLFVGYHSGGGVYDEIMSQTFLPDSVLFSSHLPDVKKSLHSFLGFFSEEIVPHTEVDLVYLWGEVSSGSSYVAIFNQNLDC